MIEELAATAKQVGNELINLSNLHAAEMQSWSELLAKNPGSVTAKLAAGFTTKSSLSSGLQMIVDVLSPPDSPPVLRTWAIEVKTGSDQLEYNNNIQLAFTVNVQQANQLVAQSRSVTRENIRQLLAAPDTKLLSITVNNEASGTAQQLVRGERYDFTVGELSQQQGDVAHKVSLSLQSALAKLQQAQPATVTETPPVEASPTQMTPPAQQPPQTPPQPQAGPGPTGQITISH